MSRGTWIHFMLKGQRSPMTEQDARAAATKFFETIGFRGEVTEPIQLMSYLLMAAYHEGAIDACERLQAHAETLLTKVKGQPT
jgi:hypothetical protein